MGKLSRLKVPDDQPIRQRDIDSGKLVRRARVNEKVAIKMNAGERLKRGRRFALESRFAEALREYVWFHEHALEHQLSQYGVRLSFALNDWMRLAAEYPPALRKLQSIRDRKTSILEQGKGSHSLFHDVVAINEALEEPHKSFELLKKLESANRVLANECGTLAIDAVLSAGDFAMAQRHWPRAENALLEFSESLNDGVVRYKRDPIKFPPRLQAYISIYCDNVDRTIEIMRGLGDKKNIPYAREWVVALVDDRTVRAKIAVRMLLSLEK